MAHEIVHTKPPPAPAPAGAHGLLPQNEPLLGKEIKHEDYGVTIQPKLTVGAPDDPFEKEADAMADKVMRMPEHSFVQRKMNDEEDKTIQKKTDEEEETVQLKRGSNSGFIQKKCAECEKEDEDNHLTNSKENNNFIQAKSYNHSSASEPSPSFASQLQQSQSGGTQMDVETKAFMESRFNADFNNVKIHDGNEAAQMNRQIGAQAFTHGGNIYFDKEKYQPSNANGKQLLAHELTHTIQQGAATQNGKRYGSQSDAATVTTSTVDKKEEKGEKTPDKEKGKEKLLAKNPVIHSFQKSAAGKKIEMPSAADKMVQEQKAKKKKGDPEELNASAAGKLLQSDVGNPIKSANDSKKKTADGAGTVVQEATADQLTGKMDEVNTFINTPFQFKSPEKQEENPELQKKKNQADVLAGGWARDAGTKLHTTIAFIQSLTPSVTETAASSKAAINAEMITQLAETALAIKKMKADAKSRAGGVIAGIKSKHTASVSGINAAAETAKKDLKKAYDEAVKLCDEKVTKQLPVIDSIYGDAAVKFRQAGINAGNHAVTVANQRAAVYQVRVTGESDGVLDGPYTSDQYEARAKAAREVGKQYKEGKGGLIDAGISQADELLKGPGKGKDRETVTGTGKTIKDALKQNYDASVNSISTSQSQAIENADKTKSGLLSAAYKALKSTVTALEQQEAAQVKIITGLANGLSDNIDSESAQTIALIDAATVDAASSMLSSLIQFRQDAQNSEAPVPELLGSHLQPAGTGFNTAITQIQNGIQNGIAQSISSLSKGTASGLSEIQTNSLIGLAQAQEITDGLKPILLSLSTSATSSFQKLQTATTTSIQKTAADSATAFGTQAQGINETFRLMNEALTNGLDSSSKEVEKAFNAAVDKDIHNVITTEAEKAAGEVSPRWKKIAKVLLVILVVVVVALVVGPAVIGFVTAGAAALGAGAAAATIGAVVGGAIVGAASGAVIQAGNNLIDGKPVLEGVGKAALIGAVSGALGGAGGALGQFITKGAQGLAPAIMRFGVDMAFDVGGNIGLEAVQAMMEGRSINWGEILTGAAISAGMSIGMNNIGKLPKVGAKVEGIQGASTKFGEGLGTKAGGAIKSKFGAPQVDTTPVKVTAPEAPKVETPEIKPETIAAPKTDAVETPAPKTDAELKPPDAEKAKQISKDAQNDEGIVAKGKADDGHELKIDEEGNAVKCSECEVYELTQKKLLDENPDLADELKAIRKKMTENPDDPAVLKELEAFDTKIKDAENFAKAKQDVLDNKQLIDEPPGSSGKLDENSPEAQTTKIEPGDIADTGGPQPGKAGSDEHRAQRWKSYEDRMNGNPKKWSRERWDKQYEINMVQAKKSSIAVDKYQQGLDWSGRAEREVRVEIEGVERRMDIMETADIPADLRKDGIIHLADLEKAGIKPRVIEHKTGDIYHSEDIKWEIARDEILMKEKGWKIEWVFEGHASVPLRNALTQAGIPYTILPSP